VMILASVSNGGRVEAILPGSKQAVVARGSVLPLWHLSVQPGVF
jgi:hypothetical protein